MARVVHVTTRISLKSAQPGVAKQMVALSGAAEQAATAAGLDQQLLELVKIRASQINGCAYCLAMHTRDARKLGETDQRLDVLAAWREAALYTEQERAALELTETITALSAHRDVPDDIYAAATAVFDEAQYAAVVWCVIVINAWNRVAVSGRADLPD